MKKTMMIWEFPLELYSKAKIHQAWLEWQVLQPNLVHLEATKESALLVVSHFMASKTKAQQELGLLAWVLLVWEVLWVWEVPWVWVEVQVRVEVALPTAWHLKVEPFSVHLPTKAIHLVWVVHNSELLLLVLVPSNLVFFNLEEYPNLEVLEGPQVVVSLVKPPLLMTPMPIQLLT